MIRFACLIAFLCITLNISAQGYRFRRLGYEDGLSDNMVSCIYKSTKGFIWIGTQLGLNRYDGIRLKRFFSNINDKNSLPDNYIISIKEDAQGKLWVHTSSGLCIFDPSTESVDRDVQGWLKKKKIEGNVHLMTTDKDHNLWFLTYGHGLWYYDFKKDKAIHVVDEAQLPSGNITGITVFGTVATITYDNGMVAGVGREHKELMWVADYITKNRKNVQPQEYKSFIDSRQNIWVYSGETAYVFNNTTHVWTTLSRYLVHDVAEDKQHNILLATDHNGIVAISPQFQQTFQLKNILFDDNSIPDNTILSLFVDNAGIVWTGTYRMGAAYYYSGRFMASTIALGDVCSIVKDKRGLLWVGTNDNGVKSYNFATGQTVSYSKALTGLASDVVVSLLVTRDGSVWVGTFQGGLARYQNGKWTSWKASAGGLADNNVWTLLELPDGNVAIGTLQNGLQILNPRTGQFRTFNTKNSALATNYVPTLSLDRKHNLLYIGNSSAFSTLNLKTLKISNFKSKDTEEGDYFSSNNFNQICVDSRGLVWAATAAGLNVYDPATKKIQTIHLMGNRVHSDIEAVTEGKDGRIWATTTNSIHAVTVKKTENGWDFMVNFYGKSDGINNRLFNKRSITCTSDGCLLFGGIDGVNLIDPRNISKKVDNTHVIFSDIAVFGSMVPVGQKFDGKVILDRAINDTHEVTLSHGQNTVTIFLATNSAGQYDRPRFMYRLEDANERWLMTPENDPSVNLTNLSYGKHTLQVRIIDRDGTPQDEISTLTIYIRPPFYFSVWAMIIYSLILLAGLWVAYKFAERRNAARKSAEDLKREKEFDTVKNQFFTNTSNELRTPLTLIITPLRSIIDEETNPAIVRKLLIIQSNANRLLAMINKMLDFRKLVTDKEELAISNANIVPLVRNACEHYYNNEGKNLHLVFRSDAKSIIMDFDIDKVSNMVNTLLDNAYQFTPDEGNVNVNINVSKDSTNVSIVVSDNGTTIGEEDKKHIFERFYVGKDARLSAMEAAGLNLLWEYAKMHGGKVTLEDNVGGGAIFTVTLPIKHGVVSGGPVFIQFTRRDTYQQETAATATSEDTEITAQADAGEEVKNKVLERPSIRQSVMSDTHDKIILIVSDNPDITNLLSIELGPQYTVLAARNGSEALYIVGTRRPDIIITDGVMPKMNGLELCKALKSDSKTKDIPIVLLSVRLLDKTNEDLKKLGFADFIEKPFNMSVLKRRIREILKGNSRWQ